MYRTLLRTVRHSHTVQPITRTRQTSLGCRSSWIHSVPSPHSSAATTSSSSSTAPPVPAPAPADTTPDLSNSAIRDALIARARHHRRARLWLVAVLTGTASLVTIYRLYATQEEFDAKKRAEVEATEAAKIELEQLCQQRDQKREKTKQLLETIIASQLPTTKSSTTTPVTTAIPNSFLSAAATDLYRQLGFESTATTTVTTAAADATAATTTGAVKTPPTSSVTIDPASIKLSPTLDAAKQAIDGKTTKTVESTPTPKQGGYVMY